MFETTKSVYANQTRDLIKKYKETPVLYMFFTALIIFSVFMFAFGTYFSYYTEIQITPNEAFYAIFLIFMVKSAVDVYNNYIKSSAQAYALSTEVKHERTISEIILAVLLNQVIIWFSLSLLFLFFMSLYKVNIFYPIEYFLFTIGVVSAIIIGAMISIHFFSNKKYRILPNAILLGFIFLSKSYLYPTLIFPLISIQYFWTIRHAISSYLYVNRKPRVKEKSQSKKRGIISTFFYKETTILWRDRLLFSFIFSSIFSALTSGYLYINGEDLIIPEAIQGRVDGFLPSMFMFLGVFVVVIYTSVFPSLILFLNEEKTLWLVRNIPLENKKIIYGKLSALLLCFITAIPYIAYISIFIKTDLLLFNLWFLVFSFIAGIIIAFPLGAKYVGKKSDMLLLYSVSMVLFAALGFVSVVGNYIWYNFDYSYLFLMLLLLVELVVLYFVLNFSADVISLKYRLKG